MIASRSAIATACVRVSASSFVRMCRTWLFTVSWLMKSLRGHVRVGHAVGEQLQDLALARREHVLALAGQERGHERRVDVALAGDDLLDRAQERLVRGLLEDVALRARLEAAPRRLRSLNAVKMRTAVSGTFSLRIFVASSPSMPGMRTSMITTSGLRRSASATALAPSEASPTTRMCGARESESRRPSRTTSWSSTIRQVISDLPVVGVFGHGPRIVFRRSDREGELLGLARRLRRLARRSATPSSRASAETWRRTGFVSSAGR